MDAAKAVDGSANGSYVLILGFGMENFNVKKESAVRLVARTASRFGDYWWEGFYYGD
jgi:hypothetical protein